MPNRAIWGWLGAFGLALVGTGTLVVLKWDTVSKNVIGVEVTDGSGPYTFALDDLMPTQPQARPVDRDHAAAK